MLTLRAILEGAPIRCEDMPRSFEVMARRLSTRLLFVSGFRSHLSRQGTPSRRLNTRLVLTPLATQAVRVLKAAALLDGRDGCELEDLKARAAAEWGWG